jgi:uncharacterized protein
MKLHLAGAGGRNLFSGYGPGYVAVNGERYERSVIVLPDRVIDWGIEHFEALSKPAFDALASLPVDVLVLGTGSVLRFPPRTELQALAQAGIGIEVMDTQAACRTYNVLLAEDRRVAAAILITR